MIEFFIKGGIFMYPILLCSITALAIFIERMWNLRRGQVIPKKFVEEVDDLIRKGEIPEAVMRCRNNRSSISRISAVALKNIGKRREIIKEYLEEVGRQETAALERFVEGLGTIAGISTLLGLLGTISGMIKIFSVISTQAAVNPASLAGGISEALITTFAGLTVAIPTVVMHRYLQSRADSLILEMEGWSIQLVDLLTQEETGE
jgi:biopolymer transport protein ExbB